MIRLVKTDAKNVWDITSLKVKKSQEGFVASNDVSVIQSYIAAGSGCTAFPFGIYNDNKPVGFLMVGYNEAAMYELYNEKVPAILRNNYSIWRLMIDRRYQNRGYGKEALRLALEFIKTWPCGKAEYCELSYVPENDVAKNLYHSFGFAETGDTLGGEIVAVLKLQ